MKNKKVIISLIISIFLVIGLVSSYAFFVFFKDTNDIVMDFGDISLTLTSDNEINLTNKFPMSYNEAYNATDNTLQFTINKTNTSSNTLYYGIKIVPTDENTIPLEYISFDICKLDLKETEYGKDSYGELYREKYYYLRNTKLSEFENENVVNGTFTEDSYTFKVRIWINDNVKIGNMAGCISTSEWESYVASFKIEVSASFNKENYMPKYAYLSKAGSTSNKFLNSSVSNYSSYIGTNVTFYSDSQYDQSNQNITYFYRSISFFKDKFLNTKVFNFKKVSTAELDYIINNGTNKTDYYDHTSSNFQDGCKVIGYFEEIYNDGTNIYYSYNFVSDGIIMFPKESSNMFEFVAYSDKTVEYNYAWNGIYDSSSTLNNYLENIEEINFDNIDTRNVVDFGYMFQNLTKLKKIDLSDFSTTVAKRLSGMFLWNQALTELDLSDFDTSRATRMDWMFAGTNIVETETEKHYIGLEDLDVSNVIYLSDIFTFCPNIEYLNLKKWKTGALVDFNAGNIKTATFFDASISYYERYLEGYTWQSIKYGTGGIMGGNPGLHTTAAITYNNLKYLDISNFDTSAMDSFESFFNSYTKLEVLKIDNWDTSNGTDFKYMFCDCPNIEEFDVTILDTDNALYVDSMFSNFGTSTYQPDYSKLKLSKVTNFFMIFSYSHAEYIDISNLDTSNANSLLCLFYGSTNLKSMDLSSLDFTNCTEFSYMFNGCTNLETVTFSDSINTNNLEGMNCMFANCNKLTNIENLDKFNTSATKYFENLFQNCSLLTTIPIDNWNMSSAIEIAGMFKGCSGLTSLDVSKWDTSSVTTIASIFSSWNTSNCYGMVESFSGCTSLTNLDLTKWDTSNVTTMYGMFKNCTSLTILDLSSFNTSKTKEISEMFYNCSNLEHIYASTNFVTTGIIYTQYDIFYQCVKLHNYSVYTESNISYAVIDDGTNQGYFETKS